MARKVNARSKSTSTGASRRVRKRNTERRVERPTEDDNEYPILGFMNILSVDGQVKLVVSYLEAPSYYDYSSPENYDFSHKETFFDLCRLTENLAMIGCKSFAPQILEFFRTINFDFAKLQNCSEGESENTREQRYECLYNEIFPGTSNEELPELDSDDLERLRIYQINFVMYHGRHTNQDPSRELYSTRRVLDIRVEQGEVQLLMSWEGHRRGWNPSTDYQISHMENAREIKCLMTALGHSGTRNADFCRKINKFFCRVQKAYTTWSRLSDGGVEEEKKLFDDYYNEYAVAWVAYNEKKKKRAAKRESIGTGTEQPLNPVDQVQLAAVAVADLNPRDEEHEEAVRPRSESPMVDEGDSVEDESEDRIEGLAAIVEQAIVLSLQPIHQLEEDELQDPRDEEHEEEEDQSRPESPMVDEQIERDAALAMELQRQFDDEARHPAEDETEEDQQDVVEAIDDDQADVFVPEDVVQAAVDEYPSDDDVAMQMEEERRKEERRAVLNSKLAAFKKLQKEQPKLYSRACAICLEINPVQRETMDACGHAFCSGCIMSLELNEDELDGAVNCAICRQRGTYKRLFEADASEEEAKEILKNGKRSNDDSEEDGRPRKIPRLE